MTSTDPRPGTSPSHGDALITARKLSKTYRLYAKPQHRIRDILGWLPDDKVAGYHHALDGVDLDIARGERVGIIGRNGAGKSTLLKLIGGVIRPTGGTLKVDGRARALLEIGSGFHPEMTGRDNARSYLAQLGTGRQATADIIEEIIDFAEIEEYIDQPLKTYSTGMQARLMFATSTAVAPDLLILDEVLGVGDAYFTGKSFARIEELCDRDGSTLLLVSHDIYTASRVCERMIWLEKGRVVFDGGPKDAIRAYEQSIRLQEENRLRAKAIRQGRRRAGATPPADQLLVEIAPVSGDPLPADVFLADVQALAGDTAFAALPLTGDREAGNPSALLLDESRWGEEITLQGRPGRTFTSHGAVFNKVGGVLRGQGLADVLERGDLELALAAAGPNGVELQVSAYWLDRPLDVHRITVTSELMDHRLPMALSRRGGDASPAAAAHGFGTGDVRVQSLELLDHLGQATLHVPHGDPTTVRLVLHRPNTDVGAEVEINIGVRHEGHHGTVRVFIPSVRFPAGETSCTVAVPLTRASFGLGEHALNVIVARPGYFAEAGKRFFSINPDVFHAVQDVLHFTATGRSALADGAAWVVVIDSPTVTPGGTA